MRLLIDLQGAQTLGSGQRGIGRYSLALALAMARNPQGHDVHLLLNAMLPQGLARIRRVFTGLLPPGNIHVWHALAPVRADEQGNETRRRIADMIREEAVAEIAPDVVHITSLLEGYGEDATASIETQACRVAVTFYDAIPLLRKQHYLDPDPRYAAFYRHKIEQFRRADLLLAISDASRQEAIEHLHIEPEKIVSISAAADAVFQPPQAEQKNQAGSEELKARFGIRGRFLMYSGAADERKNQKGLIDAYAQLPGPVRKEYQLVLAGHLPDGLRQQFQTCVLGHGLSLADVVMTGSVSDQDLAGLYAACDLYVFPSLHEGFGLPALEAMACGAAVIGSNTSSIPEVIGDERALFDPHSSADIAGRIGQVLGDEALRQSLREHGRRQARGFSWQESARRAWHALEQCQAQSAKTRLPLPAAPALLQRIASVITQHKGGVNLIALSQVLARNGTADRPQLLVDISELVERDARTGIQRVVRSILAQWLSRPVHGYQVRAVYAHAGAPGYRYADRYIAGFAAATGFEQPPGQAASADLPIDIAPGDVFLALDMQHMVQLAQQPFFEFLMASGVSVRFVVYDLLPIQMPRCFPENIAGLHQRWLEMTARSNGVVCISRAVADEYRRWLETQPEVAAGFAVDWFHMGADISASSPSQGLPPEAHRMMTCLRAQTSFLMVGTLEPRKAHAQVLEAFELLWSRGSEFNLVLVGKAGWQVEKLLKKIQSHPLRDKRLWWIGNVSDEYLEQIYATSSCLIAASLGEGFGLPIIEAAQRGLPVMARDIAVFREVAQQGAFYFKAAQPGELAEAVLAWVALQERGQAPSPADIPWQTWAQSAAQLAGIIAPEAVACGTAAEESRAGACARTQPPEGRS